MSLGTVSSFHINLKNLYKEDFLRSNWVYTTDEDAPATVLWRYGKNTIWFSYLRNVNRMGRCDLLQ